ncbi:MAG: hypothetical protein COB69_10715, partial [Phycisphaera sp.]
MVGLWRAWVLLLAKTHHKNSQKLASFDKTGQLDPFIRRVECWITSDNEKQLEEFIKYKSIVMYLDKDKNFVFMA